jgi:Fe(3+) dicitrate transport protein
MDTVMIRIGSFLLVALVLASLLALPAVTFAQPPDGGVLPGPDAGQPAPPPVPDGGVVRAPDTMEPDTTDPDAAGDASLAPAPDDEVADEEELDDLFTMTEEDLAGPADVNSDRGDEVVPDSIFRVPELEIAYTARDVFRLGGSGQLVDEEQLEALDIDDPNQLLLQVPGVYVRQEDGFGLRPNIGIRGVASDRSQKITLMEDGILFGPAPYSAPAAYYFPLMARMVGVEVFKGPAAVLYGPHTVGGAINYVGRAIPDDEAEGEVEVALGRFFQRQFHGWYGASNRWGGFLIEAVSVGSDGFKELDVPAGFADDDTGFTRTEIVATGRLQTNPDRDVFQRFELELGYSRERSNETYLGLTDADFEANPDRRYAASQLDRMAWWRTSGTVTHSLVVGEHFELRSAVYRHDFDRTWRRLNRFRDGPAILDVLANPTSIRRVFYDVLTGASDSGSVEDPSQDQTDLLVVSNARRYFSQGVQTRARFDFETGPVAHEVEAGLRLHHDGIDRDHVEEGFRMQNRQLVWDGQAGMPVTTNDAWTLAVAGYVVYAATLWERLTLTPGLRVEGVHSAFVDHATDTRSERGDVVLIPGIGAVYAFTESIAAVAGVHRGFSPVSPGQAAEVEPELSVNYELGARYMDADAEQLGELILFFNDYTNLTGACGGSSGCPPELIDRQFNGGDVHVFGAEVAGVYTFDLGGGFGVPLRGSYTFTHATFQNDFRSDNPQFGDVVAGDEVPYVPQHQAQLQVGLAREEQFSVRVAATYVGTMREEASQGDPGPDELPRTDDYVLLDVAASVALIPSIELFIKLENLLDARPIVARRPFGARPNHPIGGHIGLRATL